ncbi:MAG: hypothetical protein LBL16_01175 [Endomicrobium sp.]|jgi:hypothetical protein|nr:hypothetical protein [Endomicrobium sp.]
MRFLRNIIAFIAVPAVLSAGYTLIKTFLLFSISLGTRYTLFWIGVISYIAFQAILHKPMRTYVFGHELSHAIAGLLSGAKIKKFNVGESSGSVVLTKDNIWIALAPYFFPIYTIAIMVLYICLGWFMNIKQLYGYYLFLIGFSVSFHIALTIYILSIEQPDLKVYGTFFSYVVILAVNIVVFSLLAALAFEDGISVKNVFVKSHRNIIDIYKFIYNWGIEIWMAFQKTK